MTAPKKNRLIRRVSTDVLKEYPDTIHEADVRINPFLELHFGDTDGDFLMIINRLVAHGALSITPEEYQEIVTFFDNAKELTLDQYNRLKKIITPEKFNLCAGIYFLGDTRCERFGNDAVTLYLDSVFSDLKKNHIIGNYVQLAGNHDHEFLHFYWNSLKDKLKNLVYPKSEKSETLNKNRQEKLASIDDNNLTKYALSAASMIKTTQKQSALALSTAVKNNLISEKAVDETLEQHYFSYLHLIYCTLEKSTKSGELDRITFMSHCPVSLSEVKEIAGLFKINYKDDSAEELYNTTVAINNYFRENLKNSENIDINSDIFKNTNKAIDLVSENRKAIDINARPSIHKNKYKITYLHGHTETKNDPKHVINLNPVKHEEYKVFCQQASINRPELKVMLKKYFEKNTLQNQINSLIIALENNAKRLRDDKRTKKADINDNLVSDLRKTSQKFYQALSAFNPEDEQALENLKPALDTFSKEFNGKIQDRIRDLNFPEELWKPVLGNILLFPAVILGKMPYALIARISGYDENASPFFFTETKSRKLAEKVEESTEELITEFSKNLNCTLR